MIDFENLNFGDRIYVVSERNNAFTKKKIEKTDENGITWFRYDRDHWEYSISEIVYCGKVTYVEEGEVCFSEDRLTEYHFLYPDGQIYHENEPGYNDDFDDWFLTKEEAEAYIDFKKQTKNS
jgi:argonaute-like protein implicated in RNA metabolism and viral defense